MKDPVKQKIQELVPEIITLETYPIGRPIQLADVLRAIEKIKGNQDDFELNQWPFEWNLSTDYDGQSDETKRFIGELLNIR